MGHPGRAANAEIGPALSVVCWGVCRGWLSALVIFSGAMESLGTGILAPWALGCQVLPGLHAG